MVMALKEKKMKTPNPAISYVLTCLSNKKKLHQVILSGKQEGQVQL